MKKLMAANWKMHKTQAETTQTVAELLELLPTVPADREVVVFAPYTALAAFFRALGGRDDVAVGGQNVYPAGQGAFTGEISPAMLRDCGCEYVLVGHSERRTLFQESSAFAGDKVAFSLEQGLKVVLCVGETLAKREQGQLEAVLHEQLHAGLAKVPPQLAPESLAVAYEPVWAIGTGKVAGPAEILEAHALIRRMLCDVLPACGAEIRILYGGSVKPENTHDIIGLDNVDGVLVGGASLDAKSLQQIIVA